MAREKGRNKVINKLAFLIGSAFLIVGTCISSGIYQPFIFLFFDLRHKYPRAAGDGQEKKGV